MDMEAQEDERKRMQTLPKTVDFELPGAVCLQKVKCGKSGCRCARGELHGPYVYVFWRENGRLRKQYVRTADAEALRVAYANRQTQKACARRRHDDALLLWRNLTGASKEFNQNED